MRRIALAKSIYAVASRHGVSTVVSNHPLLVPNTLNLYGNPISQPTRAVLMLLREAKIDHVFHKVNNHAGEHRKPEYKLLLPAGLLPSLVNEKGVTLGEGAAILQYLVDRYHLSEWTSADPMTRAHISFWLHWNHTNTRNGTMQVLVPEILYPPPADKAAAILAKGQRAHARTCTFLTRHFHESGNKFLVGNTPTIADLMIVTELDQLSSRGFNIFDYTTFPRIEQYIADVKEKVSCYEMTFLPVVEMKAEIDRVKTSDVN